MDRYVKNSDTDKRAKQQEKIDKEQAKLDALLAEGGETYAMLPAPGLPAALEFDQARLNTSRIYPPSTRQYVAMVYADAALLLISLVLFILAIIMIPTQVTATGFFMSMYRLNLTNSFLPLIIPAIAAPGTVFFMKQYLAAYFQISLVEASRIGGSGEFYTYSRIVTPIMMPALATMGIMAVIASWNNYLTPLMPLSNPDMRTLPMMGKEPRGDTYRTEYGFIYLGLAMTALPLIIVYFALSQYIIQGIAVGGMKE